nr:RHS repeat-associated core domain-containing protein [Pseudoalteromonas sp. T1lg88]
MNGRVYDYNLGRFMSVDPVIQSPVNSQSINPYSYIMNNPLSGTDPTGYCAAATGTRIKDCGDIKVEVKVTMKDGSVKTGTKVVKDVNFKNGADVSSAMSAGAKSALGNLQSVDIGAPSTTAKRTGGVAGGYIDQQSAARNQRLDDYGVDIDGDVAALNGSGDQGLTAMTYSNLYVGKHDTEALLAGKLTQADLYNRAEMYATAASFVPITQGVKIGYGVYKARYFFEGSYFSKKVMRQMKNVDDLGHGFPQKIDPWATRFGRWSKEKGGDGKMYEWLRMKGKYKGKEGTFEFIKKQNGEIDHRFFNFNNWKVD